MTTDLGGINEDILEGEDMLNLEDLDEKEVLGDYEEEKNDNLLTKKEIDGDDLYDAAIEPSGVITEKRESAEVHSSLPNSIPTKTIKTEINTAAPTQQQQGKRYCCYVGNMTWWTTDAELGKVIKAFGIEDIIDIKFYENRNNGQSKGYALTVFGSEASVKVLMENLPNKKMHDQTLVVLPYTKQSLTKLEEATKRFDQKTGGNTAPNTNKEEKVINIGTIRLGANGAPVPQLMSSINLTHLARPAQQSVSQPTSLLSLNFATPPMQGANTTTNALQHVRSQQTVPPGVMVTSASTQLGPPGTTNLMNSVAVVAQQQQMAAMAAAAQQQQHVATAALLLQQQQQTAAAAGIGQQQRQITAVHAPAASHINMNQPPPTNTVVQQQAALQQAMSRPPPSLQLGMNVNTAAPPPMNMATSGLVTNNIMHAPQYRTVGQIPAGIQHQTMQSQPGFPPGAHINPQVYPAYAHNTNGAYGNMSDGSGSVISEAEFQEIMNRNQTVSSSAIHRAVSDAASGDYASAIETLVTAISLIRQSRVAHDERCKLLVNTLQDTLNGIEAKSYSSGSRKHRRERSRSPIRTSKRHRRSHSRSRSRERGGGGYDYSPMRHISSRRY